MSDKQQQVIEQCKAVAHLAEALAVVHRETATILATVAGEWHLDMVGQRTAQFMETLGDMLNNMDAVDDDKDAWMDPVFAEAQRLWPSPSQT